MLAVKTIERLEIMFKPAATRVPAARGAMRAMWAIVPVTGCFASPIGVCEHLRLIQGAVAPCRAHIAVQGREYQ